jgi:ATP-dependent RNA helicase RhlE
LAIAELTNWRKENAPHMQFQDLMLSDPLLRALANEGYTEPTPIQAQAIPHLLDRRDLIGLAQTGTGKTAAFALPVLQRLSEMKRGRGIRALILAPTRELASQIAERFQAYGRETNLSQVTVFGGVSQNPQVKQLRRGVNIVIATPGRLLDLMNQGAVRLDGLEMLVLDEADRMMDMGFLPDIRRIISQVPAERQTILFSATMSPEIQKIAAEFLNNPVEVAVTPESTPVETIDQQVFFVEKANKRKLLLHLFREHKMQRTLVFMRTKHSANKLTEQLNNANIQAQAIHGNKTQSARERALANFRKGKTSVLVATDIAARGIDVDEVTHVINFDLPNESESYVHRIGRTGRAGLNGIAYSFCSTDERDYLRDIERLIQAHIPVVDEHPYLSNVAAPEPTILDRKRAASSLKQAGKKSGKKSGYNGGKQGGFNGGNPSGEGRKRRRRTANGSKRRQLATP